MTPNLKIWRKVHTIESIILAVALCGIFIATNTTYQLYNKKVITLERQHKLATRIASLEIELKNLRQYELQINALENDYTNLSKTIRSAFQEQLLLNELNNAANKTEVSLKSLRLLPPKKDDELIIHPWLLTVQGEYNFLVKFLNLITSSESNQFVSVINTHLKPGENDNKMLSTKSLILEILLYAYEDTYKMHYLSKQELPSKQQPKENSIILKRDPFAPTSPNLIHRFGLNVWPLSKLKLMGILQNKTKIWAIISDPNGNIYKANAENKIGLSNEVIATIKATEIIFTSGRKLHL